jgi:hypothetical protein
MAAVARMERQRNPGTPPEDDGGCPEDRAARAHVEGNGP